MPITFDKERRRWRYQLHRHVGGKRVRVNKILPKGWSRAQAQAFDDAQTSRIIAELTGIQRRVDSLERAVELYLIERVPALKSSKSVIEDLAAIHGYYAGKAMTDLPDISREYARDSLGRLDVNGNPDPLAPATIRKRIALLRAAARYAWKHHNMGEHDPGERVYIPTVRNERQTYLDRATVVPLVRKMASDTRGAALIAFYSGMRLAEILRAKAKGDAFILADSKNGAPRMVPIHRKVAVYARKGPKAARAWIQRQFMRVTREAGLKAHFHDLRHSAASEMINADVDLYTVGAVLGHKSAQSTKRYAHLAQAKLKQAVQTIGRRNLSPTHPKKAA